MGTLSEIHAGITGSGGKLLSSKVRLKLRSEYTNKPRGKRVLMAIDDFGSDLCVFDVGKGDDRGQSLLYVPPDELWSSRVKWMFTGPRFKQS